MKKNISILIVEDEALIARWLKTELELHSFEVCGMVASGEEAIILAKEKDPDVILMDIYLTGDIDGIDAAHKIIEYKRIPIIFMTGHSESDKSMRIQEVNPIAYLEKPVEIYELKPLLESIFE